MAATAHSFPDRREAAPEPAWEIARLFPPQGQWSEGVYLSFTESMSQIVELVDGSIEVPEMPTRTHQRIVHLLLSMLLEFLGDHKAGDAVAAPYRVWLRDGTFREPDIVAYVTSHLDRFGERYGKGADMVIEVVSDDPASRVRDYEDKRRDYALAGISEYWIVDPTAGKVLVLALDGSTYRVVREAGPGEEGISQLFNGFRVSVDAILTQSGSAE